MANFQRTKSYAYVKLGSRQKSMKKYRRATGRHNKTRQKWRGRPPMVQIGYKNNTQTRGLINNKMPITVYNLADLNKLTKDNIAIFGKIGNKLRIEMAKQAMDKKIEVYNLNITKFLKETEKLNKKEKKA
jgi:large subunit ribosomal protein L32e